MSDSSSRSVFFFCLLTVASFAVSPAMAMAFWKLSSLNLPCLSTYAQIDFVRSGRLCCKAAHQAGRRFNCRICVGTHSLYMSKPRWSAGQTAPNCDVHAGAEGSDKAENVTSACMFHA